MKLFSLLTMLLVAFALQGQTITQKGVAYRYNGKKARTPIGGVYIKPVTGINGVVSDESNGTFTISLKNKKMGDRIGYVQVTKQGMMVFNQTDVEDWNVRKFPLRLILCDADQFDKQKKNLISIGKKEAKKKYEKELAKLQKINREQQLKIDEYYNKLDSLDKEYQNALKQMDKYADVFARIDESEVDTLAQHAIDLFNRGEIEQAIQLFEEGNFEQKLDDALRTKEQAQALRQVADSAETLADNEITKYVNSIKTQIAAYKLKNNFEKAGELLKHLADKLNTLDAIWDYANFCLNQNEYKEAEIYYLKCKMQIKPLQSEEIDEQWFYANKYLAKVFNGLAIVYQKTQRFCESEEMYKAALEIRQLLAKLAPKEYEKDLAIVYNNLAVLYVENLHFAESEAMHKAALEIRQRLAKDSPEAYEQDLAVSYHNLGILYSKTQRLIECEEVMLAELEIFQRLAKENPEAFEQGLSTSYNGLGALYQDSKRFSESEAMLKAALEIRQRLAKENPGACEPDLAVSYNNLGVLYEESKRFSESEAMHKAALEIRLRLAKVHPEVFEPDLADTYNNLGVLYEDSKRFSESEAMHKDALEIRQRLAKENPGAYEPDLLQSYKNLQLLFFYNQRLKDCMEMYKAAIPICKSLAKKNWVKYEHVLADQYFSLALLCCISYQFKESEDSFKAAIEVFKQLVMQDKQYLSKLYKAYTLLAKLYIITQRFSEGEQCALEALKVDSTNSMAYTNLAAALLLQGRVDEAEKIYRDYKAEYKKGFLDDFAEFERLGIIPEQRKEDVERIKAILNEE